MGYEPYAGGFFYDSLPVVLNSNRGCDLKGITTLGTAAITATARYPYQPVDANPVTLRDDHEDGLEPLRQVAELLAEGRR